MVEIFEADDINPCTDERFVRHEDYAKALALIDEMKELLAYTAPFCDMRDDYQACMALVARAEELLRD